MSKRKAMFFSQSGSGFSAEYQAVLDKATALGYTLPSSGQNDINNNKIVFIKNLGIWGADLFYVFNQESGLEDFCTINWADPDNFQLNNPTPANVPDYVSGSGFKTLTGSSKLFFTGFIPTSDAVFSSKRDCALIFSVFDVETTFVGLAFHLGARVGNDNEQFFIANTANNKILMRTYGSSGGSNTMTITQSNVNAHYHIDDLETTANRYINGVSHDSVTNPGSPTDLTTLELYVLGFNNNGNPNYGRVSGLKYLILTGSVDTYQNEIYEIMNEIYTP